MRFHVKQLAQAAALALAASAMAASSPPPPDAAGRLMTWPDLLGRPRPQPTATVHYGPDPLQVADLWVPPGRGRHPVILMVHGGCWQTDIADRTIMNWIAEDLRRRGIAVWNIDYRGVDRPGGGYPGTFQDVAAAADALPGHAAQYRLDLSHLVAIGHSAGGHLAAWAATREDARVPLTGLGLPSAGTSSRRAGRCRRRGRRRRRSGRPAIPAAASLQNATVARRSRI